jgi:exodeoxyribonuclease V beta subunit
VQRFDVLDEKTSIFGSRVIEASAGTGKTFTIEHLVVRLLKESDIKLNQVLVVTFTRAATRDLKKRIRGNLAKNYPSALLTFDEAQIFTIHGFCHKIITEFAFEADTSTTLSERTSFEELEEVKRFLKEALTQYSAPQVDALLRQSFGDLSKLGIQVLKETPHEMPTISDALSSINDSLKTLPYFPIAEEFDHASESYKRMRDPHFSAQALLFDRVLKNQTMTQDDLNQIIRDKRWFLFGINPGNLKVRGENHPLLETLSSILTPLITPVISTKSLLKNLSFQWRLRRSQLQAEQDFFSHDDLLEKVRLCLENEAFLTKVRSKYQAVIIDEFQDTDPIQWTIFKTLFADQNLKAFYLVGDPKQSIYAFRNADIYIFMDAVRTISPEGRLYLDTNYRSGQGLGADLNRLFAEKEWIDLPKEKSFLPVPVTKYAKEIQGALHFFVAEGIPSREKKWPTSETEETLLFPFIWHEIASKNYDLAQVAVLVRDRHQALRLRQFLKPFNVPVSLKRSHPLKESPAWDDWKEIIQCIKNPSDLTRLSYNPRITAINSDEQEFLKSVLYEKGFGAFYAQLKSKLIESDELNEVAAILAREKNLDLIDEYRRREIDERVKPAIDGIQIMTIHASKGLEFDVVFALGLASRTRSDDEDDLEESDAEKMRQLYVAMTRAKTALYVPIIKSDKETSIGTASPIEIFLERTAPDLSTYSVLFLNQMQFDLHKRIETLEPKKTITLPEGPGQYILSFSSLSTATYEAKEIPEDDMPAGAEVGVIIHKLFEQRGSVEEELRGSVLEGWEKEVQALLDNTYQAPLDGFSLADVDPAKMMHEMEFLYPTPQGLMKGFIDLCFEHKGKYYIIDWKTNWLPSYSQESMEKAMNEGDYFLQAGIYKSALQRYLSRTQKKPFEKIFGGVFYIFVRGPGVYHVD